LVKVLNVSEAAELIINYLSRGYVLACVGTYLRRDDYLALYLCRRLRNLGIEVVECEYGLENCIDAISELRPRGLVVIDALVGDTPVGSIIASGIDELSESLLATTHSIPVKLVVKYLMTVYDVEDVVFIGIRAKDLGFGEGLSTEVREVIDSLCSELVKRLH